MPGVGRLTKYEVKGKSYVQDYTKCFYVMRELTCFHNMMCYLTVILDVLETEYEQGELGFAIKEAVSNRIY